MKRRHALVFGAILILCAFIISPAGISNPISYGDDGCEDCHSEFKAFTVTIDAPKEVPDNYDFEYKVIVRNTGEHKVQKLQTVMILSEAPNLKATMEGGEPYHEEMSGSVGIGGTQSYSFPVTFGAVRAEIILDGDEGLHGRNNIDLAVTSPSGQEWISEESGADEQISLDAGELERGGAGDYDVTISYFIGGPSISFTLTMDVEYSVEQQLLKGPDLGSGESHTFTWPLSSSEKGDNTVLIAVSGTAHHEHSENEDPLTTDSKDYTIEKSSNLKVGDKYVYEPPKEEFQGSISILLLERVTGLLSGVLLILSIGLCGYLKPISSWIEKVTGGRASRIKWHCRVSLVLIFLSLLHGIMLPFSPHARSLKGLALGTTAFLALTALGYLGWQQKPLKKRLGMDTWSRLHLILTIAAVAIVVIHALLEGSDFAWLR
ncbi:MAG: ferric reductase-like transmembrane domain-containing protein [Thermoplasmata archaeon]|nr:MAG: ferric reductase-like transmembrane domain-containing protein [Thermoplasmata archaeon]